MTPLLLIDLCAALLASRATLLHMVQLLQEQGYEVAVWSALPRANAREALSTAGILEIFDNVLYVESVMCTENYEELHAARWLSYEATQAPVDTLRAFGVRAAKLPTWLGWVS